MRLMAEASSLIGQASSAGAGRLPWAAVTFRDLATRKVRQGLGQLHTPITSIEEFY